MQNVSHGTRAYIVTANGLPNFLIDQSGKKGEIDGYIIQKFVKYGADPGYRSVSTENPQMMVVRKNVQKYNMAVL